MTWQFIARKQKRDPLVILEYLSAGLPFLAINRGEVAFEVSTEFSELIIDNYGTEQWIDRIRLIQLGLTQYPKTLPVFFKEKFSTETYYTNLQDIYNRVI